MREPDLDNSWVVEAVTWTMYLGFLSVPAAAALYFELEPLRTIRGWFPGWTGIAAAVASGVALILAFRWGFDRLRGGGSVEGPPDGDAPTDDGAAASTPPPQASPKKRKRSNKKKKRKR
jgi:hypothetical protein